MHVSPQNICATDFVLDFCLPGSQHHVEKALSLIGKKFKELSLTNIYAPPPPSLTLHSLPMTSWVSPGLLALVALWYLIAFGECLHISVS